MIDHLDKLDYKSFLFFMDNFHECTITEKLDGANLQVGKADDKLFVSRNLKGGKVYNSLGDWPDETWVLNFKQAHKALQKSNLIDFMENGDLYDLEVLGSPQPNTIDYNTDHASIVFLRTLAGKPNYETFLKQTSPIKTTTICLWSDDGQTLYHKEIENLWKFFGVKEYSPDIFDLEAIENKISHMKFWTIEHTYCNYLSNGEISLMKFNKCPENLPREEFRKLKSTYKVWQTTINSYLKNLQLDIKNHLIANRKEVTNTFGTVSGMEGFIVHHKPSNKITKIVDRTHFTFQNSTVWEYPEYLKPCKQHILNGIARAAGLPNLAYPSQKSNIIKFRGLDNIYQTAMANMTEDTLATLVGAISENISLIHSIIEEYETEGLVNYSKYNKEKHLLFFADINQFANKAIEYTINRDKENLIRLLLGS